MIKEEKTCQNSEFLTFGVIFVVAMCIYKNNVYGNTPYESPNAGVSHQYAVA